MSMARWKTREVFVGGVGVGGRNPIRIQSMTTTDTRNVDATTEQIIRLADAGCEIVRVTVQGKKEAEACEGIKNNLIKRGCFIPLVADIHFYPPAALLAVEYVDKVRINPGNFSDKRASFKIFEYDDDQNREDIAKIEEDFLPFVEKCKILRKAMRIGVNHGSLSDRIMNKYGNTPLGMVESAIEFTNICRKVDYHDIIFSMKSSKPQIMIEAYRLLIKKMDELGWDYPIHLGVTESGAGREGRIKSSIGIGALLLDGIGDTIRISLTEDPCSEIDPCRRLVSFINGSKVGGQEKCSQREKISIPQGLHQKSSVILSLSEKELLSNDFFQKIGLKNNNNVNGVVVNFHNPKLEQLSQLGVEVVHDPYIVTENFWDQILVDRPALIFFSPTVDYVYHARRFFKWLCENDVEAAVILQFAYTCSEEDFVVRAAAEVGSLLCDGFSEGICFEVDLPLEDIKNISFEILQGAGRRISKTEFISCPGCGRTLFDLQTTASRISKSTNHLPGVKIAVMGCIVNGPGEMSDADFGCVGSRPGMVDLYVGKKCVEKDVKIEDAEDKLVSLIKENGRWVDP